MPRPVSAAPARTPDVAQQPYLPKVAEQFKPRVLSGSDHVHMRRMVIVRIDHHAPALEDRENGWHTSV